LNWLIADHIDAADPSTGALSGAADKPPGFGFDEQAVGYLAVEWSKRVGG
jgi:hypothetical protein